MNIKSKLINKSELAKLAGMKPAELHNKLTDQNRNKPLTNDEVKRLEAIIINELKLK